MNRYQPFQSHQPVDLVEEDLRWLVFFGQKLVLPEDGYFWRAREWIDSNYGFVAGLFDGHPIAVVHVDVLPEEGQLMEPRAVMASDNIPLIMLYNHTSQLLLAKKMHHFCGCCGHQCRAEGSDWAMVCSSCSMRHYPRISPCIIVLVQKGNEVLLVQHQSHLRHYPVYTTIAGFIEPGEDAETAVAREVEEEAGIKVKNIRYFFSQSWPFPHSLMLGFHADYESGDLQLQEDELSDGKWFPKTQLPDAIPPKFTIARKLIDLALDA